MSDSVLILPSSYVNKNNLNTKLIDDTPYYKRTLELVGLLLDVGAVVINPSTGIFEFTPFINSSIHPNIFIGRLLGYIAEGIVVRACNESLSANRRWANIARVLKQEPNYLINVFNKIFYESFLDNPDKYKAIGTGFAKTAKDRGHLYNPQSDRDICWIHGFDDAKELLSIKGIKLNKQRHAGLQLKVSIKQNAWYVVNYFCAKPYFKLYPVVYFDLGNDFDYVRQQLLDIITSKNSKKKVSENSILNPNIVFNGFSKDEIIQTMLIRGKDVHPSLHEELEFYRHTLEQLVSGKISLFDFNDDNVIISLMTEYLAVKNVMSKNPNQESILNLSI
ncbi:hypothetical protein NDI44_25955 [Trichocoleus sp. DQ-A3]|uniref:hypothetical protein n=1 Tax=Cyanophyceae TaxID=3028117 RepID=UPI0016836373|nr:hypothetical protein [Coleofasciculus sp. FACHB-125]MBD1903476.1 hypothetical protein [Coleofasciculus sp. FACHB-125]